MKIIGYEHNWVDAANYPVQLVRLAAFLTCIHSWFMLDATGGQCLCWSVFSLLPRHCQPANAVHVRLPNQGMYAIDKL